MRSVSMSWELPVSSVLCAVLQRHSRQRNWCGDAVRSDTSDTSDFKRIQSKHPNREVRYIRYTRWREPFAPSNQSRKGIRDHKPIPAGSERGRHSRERARKVARTSANRSMQCSEKSSVDYDRTPLELCSVLPSTIGSMERNSLRCSRREQDRQCLEEGTVNVWIVEFCVLSCHRGGADKIGNP